jgi:guanylate kinase
LEAALDRGDKLIADIEVVGGGELKKAFPDSIVLIFIAPPSLESLETRLRKRGNVSEQELAERLKRGAWEMTFRDRCDYVVTNDDLKRAVDQVVEIVEKELYKVENP